MTTEAVPGTATDPKPRRRVLVTGAAGFIGFRVVQAIVAREWEAVGFDIVTPEMPPGGAPFVQGDIGDVHLLHRIVRKHSIDTIVHGGGISGPMLLRDNPHLICRVNVVGTLDLLEIARNIGLRRLVHLSSAAAYGDTPPPPVPEASPLAARDIYGASKAAADILMRAYREQHGVDAVALRISNAYGPGRRTRCAIRTMITDALAGRSSEFEWGADIGRAYLFIEDAVAAVVAAIEAPAFCQPAYNIAGAEFEPMKRIAAKVRTILPAADIRFEPGVDPLGARREQLDISAAARDLDWVPRWDLVSGITRYAEWLRDRQDARSSARQ